MITLDSNPSDAPCCVKIINDDGRDVLVQQDWDWPSIATAFGWSVRKCQWPIEDADPCDHNGTDGTVKCPDCSMPVSYFLQSAREWLDEHDGEQAEDPGYFNE